VPNERQIYCDDGTCPAAAVCARYWTPGVAETKSFKERPKIKRIKYPRDPAIDHCIAYVPRDAKIYHEKVDVTELMPQAI
jgi:hypothetical protein